MRAAGGIRDGYRWLEFRRVLIRSLLSPCSPPPPPRLSLSPLPLRPLLLLPDSPSLLSSFTPSSSSHDGTCKRHCRDWGDLKRPERKLDTISISATAGAVINTYRSQGGGRGGGMRGHTHTCSTVPVPLSRSRSAFILSFFFFPLSFSFLFPLTSEEPTSHLQSPLPPSHALFS